MAEILILLLKAYRACLSPLLPRGICRFEPSCSRYAMDAIATYGAGKGLRRAVRRLLRCHPLHPGGYDPA
ncbi:MAG: membrane protein insertion efficiency factor YidD [Bacteroidota bacterium]